METIELIQIAFGILKKTKDAISPTLQLRNIMRASEHQSEIKTALTGLFNLFESSNNEISWAKFITAMKSSIVLTEEHEIHIGWIRTNKCLLIDCIDTIRSHSVDYLNTNIDDNKMYQTLLHTDNAPRAEFIKHFIISFKCALDQLYPDRANQDTMQKIYDLASSNNSQEISTLSRLNEVFARRPDIRLQYYQENCTSIDEILGMAKACKELGNIENTIKYCKKAYEKDNTKQAEYLLAMILEKDSNVLEYARAMYQKNNTDVDVAFYLVHLSDLAEPLDEVVPNVKDDPKVRFAEVLNFINNKKDWVSLVKRDVVSAPSEQLRLYNCAGTIADVTILSEHNIEHDKAYKYLFDYFDKINKGDYLYIWELLPLQILVHYCYSVDQDTLNIILDKILLLEISDNDTLKNIAKYALSRCYNDADKIINKIKNPIVKNSLSLEYLALRGAVDKILAMNDAELDDYARGIKHIFGLHKADKQTLKKEFYSTGDLQHKMSITKIAEFNSFEDLAVEFDNEVNRIVSEYDEVHRINVIQYFYNNCKYDKVISILENIDITKNNEFRLMLAVAYANEYPTEKSKAFFDKLDCKKLNAVYQRCAATHYYSLGNFGKARKIFNYIYSNDKLDGFSLSYLLLCNSKLGNKENKKLIKNVDLEKLRCSNEVLKVIIPQMPTNKNLLNFLIKKYNETQESRYLDYFTQKMKEYNPDKLKTASEGVYVEVLEENTNVIIYGLYDGAMLEDIQNLHTQHPLYKMLINLDINCSILYQNKNYKITRIIDKFVHTFHQIMNKNQIYNTNFKSFNIERIEDFLSYIKDLDHSQKECFKSIVSIYEKQQFPLVLISLLHKNPPLQMQRDLIEYSKKVVASPKPAKMSFTSVVPDVFSFIILMNLNVLGNAKTKILIPAKYLDYIVHLKVSDTAMGKLSVIEGRVAFNSYTPKSKKLEKEQYANLYKNMQKHIYNDFSFDSGLLEKIPVEHGEHKQAGREVLLETLLPMQLAASTGVLVTDDPTYAGYAQVYFKDLQCYSTQSLIQHYFDEGILNEDEFFNALILLCQFRRRIFVDNKVLKILLARATLYQIPDIIRAAFHSDLDYFYTNLHVMEEMGEKVAYKILEAFLYMNFDFIVFLYYKASNNVKYYIELWVRGHFLIKEFNATIANLDTFCTLN